MGQDTMRLKRLAAAAAVTVMAMLGTIWPVTLPSRAMAARPAEPGNPGATSTSAAAPDRVGTRQAMGMEVVARHDLGQAPGNTSDVWYNNGVAFVGYRCGQDRGSSILDVSDPENPVLLFQTTPMSATFANDVKALSVDTLAFTGDLLLEPHDRCGGGPPAQMRIWDVTNPASVTLLGTFTTGDGVHNSYAYQRGDRAYIILAAPGADSRNNTNAGYEDQDLDADFVIVDISDPTAPVAAGRWNAHETWSDLPGSTFQHDVWANPGGTVAYGAYWDGGLVLLDISDPADIKALGRYGYSDVAEGNTHAAVPTKNEDYVVITDEDFSPHDSVFAVEAPPDLAGPRPSTAGAFMNVLVGTDPLVGDVVWVGRGCGIDASRGITVADEYLNDATGKVAAMVRGACTFANKISTAEDNGAVGAIIINQTAGTARPPMGGSSAGIGIPGVGISHDVGNVLTSTTESGITVTVRMAVEPGEWGFTRMADVSDVADVKLVAEYVIPETRAFPSPPGSWTVHNPWVVGDMLYLSHYWAGVRMVDISDPTDPVEQAFIIPPSVQVTPTQTRRSNIWGVITDERGLIYASDINNGLWILRESGSVASPGSLFLPLALAGAVPDGPGAVVRAPGPAAGPRAPASPAPDVAPRTGAGPEPGVMDRHFSPEVTRLLEQ